MDINKLLRKNIKSLKPYSSARDEYTGKALVYLDANENPYNQPYNRYPDPLQRDVKQKIAGLKKVEPGQIFLGNGSDEPIDLLIRAFCDPGEDNLIVTQPTYGMYEVAAGINNVEVRKCPLDEIFQVNPSELLKTADGNTKLIFLCSPNNPTGNSLNRDLVIELIENFRGLIILDEAYIDFAAEKTFLPDLKNYNNLAILQTFSKAWGMAGIRLGMAFASQEIISVLNKIKYPYNVNILTQQKALELLKHPEQKEKWVKLILTEKDALVKKLEKLPFTVKVYPSDANFVLVKIHDALGIYDYLVERAIIVRDRSKVHLCENSLRITIGTSEENKILIDALNELI